MITQALQQLTGAVEADARALVDLYAARRDAVSLMAAHPSATHAEAALAAGDALDVARETFRRRHFPRRAEVVVAGYGVYLCSRTRSRVELVLDLHDEYVLPALAGDGEW